MFGFGKHGPDGRYGAVVDIGSGSVGVAIVASDPLQSLPVLVWSHREWTTIRDIEALDEAAKDITTATMNAFLELGSSGGKALRAYDPKATISDVQVSFCAPWSYTIAKSVSSTAETEFKISKALINELINTAQAEALAVIDADDFMQKLGLEVISDATISLTANGYLMKNPIGQVAKSVTVTQLTGVTEQRLLETVRDASEKIFKSAPLLTTTFMFQYYLAMQERMPDMTEVCLFDITAEATEIGIVRDGVLKYATHMPYGTVSIAREISALCGIPKEEALGLMRSNNIELAPSLAPQKQAELQAILTSFDERLRDLMRRTGDALAIPKTVYLHTDALTEAFFKSSIERAGVEANTVEHSVHPITSKLFTATDAHDTAILLSAYVFHKKLHETATLDH